MEDRTLTISKHEMVVNRDDWDALEENRDALLEELKNWLHAIVKDGEASVKLREAAKGRLKEVRK